MLNKYTKYDTINYVINKERDVNFTTKEDCYEKKIDLFSDGISDGGFSDCMWLK